MLDLKGRTELFGATDVIDGLGQDYEGQIIVMGSWRVENFKEQYRKPEFQLFLAQGGFGCSPTAIGTMVFGRFLADGEQAQFRRGDFMGVLKPELVAEYGLKELLTNEE